MNIVEKAKTHLSKMRKHSKMWAWSRESFVCQVNTILCFVTNCDQLCKDFLPKHLKLNGCAYDLKYMLTEIEINDGWCYKVVDDALNIIEKYEKNNLEKE